MTERKNRIVDEKGRLFGKVNIIDLIVLLLIAAVAVVLVLKVTGKAGSGLPGDASTSQIEYTVLAYRVSPEVYDSIEKEIALGGEHTQLMANGEMLAGSEITAVTARDHMESISLEDGTIVQSKEGNYVDVIFTIRATITNSITQAVGTQEVRIGKTHIVKTKTVEVVNGIILDCQPVQPAA